MNRSLIRSCIPYLIVVAVVATTCLFWFALKTQERATIERNVELKAKFIRSEFESDLKYHVSALERMASRWGARGKPPYDEWKEDADDYLQDFDNLHAVEWVDPTFHVQWVEPLEGNEMVVGMESAFEPKRRAALEAAIASNSVIMTQPIDLVQGGQGVLIYCPINQNQEFHGFILGVLRINKLLANVRQRVASELYHAHIHINDQATASQQDITAVENLYVREIESSLYGVTWRYHITPSQQLLDQLRSPLPTTTLLTGGLLCGLLLIMAHMSRRLRSRSLRLSSMNQQLHDQITKREKIEQSLRETQLRFELAVAGTSDGLWDWDIKTNEVWYAPRFKELLGYKDDDDFPGVLDTFSNHLHPEDRDPTFEAVHRHLEENKPYDVEYRLRTKNGEYRWFRALGRAVRDDTGKAIRMAGSIRDVTVRRQADQVLKQHIHDLAETKNELKANQERFELAVDGTSDGLWDWFDVSGDAEWWSPRFYELLGYENNEIEASLSQFKALLHPDDRDRTFEAVQIHLEDNKPFDIEYRLKTKPGEYRWFHARGKSLRDDSGKPTRMAGSIQDITDRKETEWALSKQTEDMALARQDLEAQAIELAAKTKELEHARALAESAANTKSEFLANMSHEIRTPMTAILGYADLLTDPDQPQEEASKAIQTIRRNGQHLLAVINDILDFSKIEAGKMTVEQLECSTAEIVNDVISLMHDRATGKNLRLAAELAGAVPKTIRTDPTRLRQILINLISNAIKFTEHGAVRLVIGMADDANKTEQHLSFDVIDSGIGMTPEQQEKLFQAFSQADTSMTRKFGGTGLGLMISKRLAEMMGGDITAACKLNEGCTFTVNIATGPLDGVPMINSLAEAKPDNKPATNTATDKASPLDCRILLAEDGPDNQRLISFVLKKAGAQVDIAEDGLIAYEKATAAWKDQKPYDVILMDMQMPNMDGYEATAKLRQDGYQGPIIALTAHAMPEHRKRSMDAGCDEYATKPINKSTLIALIQRFLHTAQKDTVV